MNILRVACIGGWHVHGKDFSLKAQKLANCQLVAICSENEETGKAWAAELNCRFGQRRGNWGY